MNITKRKWLEEALLNTKRRPDTKNQIIQHLFHPTALITRRAEFHGLARGYLLKLTPIKAQHKP